jgi:hypothetical protein
LEEENVQNIEVLPRRDIVENDEDVLVNIRQDLTGSQDLQAIPPDIPEDIPLDIPQDTTRTMLEDIGDDDVFFDAQDAEATKTKSDSSSGSSSSLEFYSPPPSRYCNLKSSFVLMLVSINIGVCRPSGSNMLHLHR